MTRDRANGRYAHAHMDRLCTCGHTLGVHTAAVSNGTRECLAGDFGDNDCNCQRFTAVKASTK